jgi:hypothetical protein
MCARRWPRWIRNSPPSFRKRSRYRLRRGPVRLRITTPAAIAHDARIAYAAPRNHGGTSSTPVATPTQTPTPAAARSVHQRPTARPRTRPATTVIKYGTTILYRPAATLPQASASLPLPRPLRKLGPSASPTSRRAARLGRRAICEPCYFFADAGRLCARALVAETPRLYGRAL